MKRLVLAITLASLAALPHGGAAAPRARQCPNLSVSCPDMISMGSPVTFTANVGHASADAKLTYNWVVSVGTISSGQGTSSITVDTVGIHDVSALTATVEVGGFPEPCSKSAACTAAFPPVCRMFKIDEYGNIKFEDERARLDNFAIELQNDPSVVGYIVGYGGRRSQRGEALGRLGRAKKYLTNVRGIDASRLVTLDSGYREELTVELWVIPKSVPPPQSYPTVDPNEVEFIKPQTKRGARRRLR